MIEMVALRPFSRMFGDSIRRLKAGEKFFADEKSVSGLVNSGKAEKVAKEPVRFVRKFKANEDE